MNDGDTSRHREYCGPSPSPTPEPASSQNFVSTYFPPSRPPTFTHPRNGSTYTITPLPSSQLSATQLESCLNLIAKTSSSAYANSSKGWRPAAKRKEMRTPEMWFLLVRQANVEETGSSKDHDGAGSEREGVEGEAKEEKDVEAFLSFMLTWEDGFVVVYCYEVHLAESLRGCGLGSTLMGMMEGVGRAADVDKSMLTVFAENEKARRFYERIGYEFDESTPNATKLRNGKVSEPGYFIMSKRLK
ncbi:MAG: hypothetical protein M1825_005183 [Sarcosagium campestre]|nr:MAG: hypothetical protein M1825_005183 [Sarcosagium campestre]